MATIVIAGVKGGTGKTTTATILADGLGATLIDLDPETVALRWMARRKPNKTGPNVIATTSQGLQQTLDGMTTANVVIDTPGVLNQDIIVAAQRADLIIIPMQPSGFDVGTLPMTLKTLRRHNPIAPVWVYMTQAGHPRSQTVKNCRDALEHIDVNVLDCMSTPLEPYRRRSFTGQTVLQEREGTAKTQAESLIEEINKALKELDE